MLVHCAPYGSLVVEPEGAHHVQPFQPLIKKDPGGPFFISGGEGGIRTLDRGYLYSLSRGAPSATRPPLREARYCNGYYNDDKGEGKKLFQRVVFLFGA